MPTCDNCGTEASHVWHHESLRTETSRTVDWLCRSCHPEIRVGTRDDAETTADTASPADAPTGSPADATADAGELRSDGGVPGTAPSLSSLATASEGGRCPACAGALVNGQGMLDCLDCDWTGAV